MGDARGTETRNAMKPYRTTRYKAFMLGMLAVLASVIIGGTFYLQSNPYAQGPLLSATMKRWFYTFAFAADITRYDRSDSSLVKLATSSLSVPVLVYHGVITHLDGSAINLTEQEFKDQMFALKKAGYSTISIDQLYSYATKGGKLPANPVVITFDDGRSDTFYNGDPILAALGFNANIFVITAFSKDAKPGNYYLSPEELQLVAKTGRWTIGSHSSEGHVEYQTDQRGDLGYFYSNNLWLKDQHRNETDMEFLARIENDFKVSKTYLEDLLQKPIDGFAFPFGDLGQNAVDASRRSKEVIASASTVYDMLFYQYTAGSYFTQFMPPDTDTKTLLVHRIDMTNNISGDELVRMLALGAQKALPFTDTFTADTGWLNVWGTHSIANHSLSMKAAKDQSGAATLIDGSQSWKDYTAAATLISPNRTSVYLWMRFKDSDTNAGCNFGPNFVHIEETTNGIVHVLKGVTLQGAIPAGSFTIAGSVNGRTLSCSINGKEVVSTDFLDPSLTRGGTGVKIWDETPGKSEVRISNFSAAPIGAAG